MLNPLQFRRLAGFLVLLNNNSSDRCAIMEPIKLEKKIEEYFSTSSPCQVRSHNLLGLKQSQQIHLGKIIWERILPFTLLFCFAFLEEHKCISSTNLCSITDLTENNIAKHLTPENLNYFRV
jgi:hypothetical protein